MARVFSWKVSENKYSYLIKDSATNSYIRNKITDINALHSMANNVDGWSEATYRDAFMAMRAEVNNVFGNFADSDWRKYFDASPIKGADIVLLSGKDGANGNSSIKDILSEDDYNELTEAIEKTFEQYRQEIEANADLVKQAIEAQVSSTVRDALNSIAETQAELDGMRNDMEETARSLRDALDAAANADWGEGISQEQLDAINSKIGYFSDWINHYSGAVLTMKSDYDAASQSIGAWAVQQDVSRGLFSMLCTNINVLSGTVGVVQRTINAASGTSQDTASWYDEINGRVTEIESTMNASESYLQQLVKFIDGDDTTQLYNVICGLTASIVSSAQHQGTDASGNTVDLTDVYQRISALSGRVDVEINRLDTTNDTLTTIRTDLNALEGQVSTALTIANDALTKANDMRDTWNAESGMLRTVTDLVIKRDGNGDPIYWYINPELEDPSDKTRWKRVYYQGEDSETGLPYYTENKDGSGEVYTKDVLPDYMSTMLSYIQQQAGSIELAVTSGDVISALKLTVTEDGDSIIYGFADRVILDSDVIAKSLTANAANIGGVHIGEGMISAGTGNSKWALTSVGTLEANNAILKGSISADSGYFKGSISATNGYFSGTVIANGGTIGGLEISKDGLVGDNFSLTNSGLSVDNAVIRGSIRQPFAKATNTLEEGSFWGDEEEETVNTTATNDNLYMDYGNSGLISYEVKLMWNVDQIGRRITLVLNKGGNFVTTGTHTIEADPGYYFFEDGFAHTALTMSNEVVELLGFGKSDTTPPSFYGYIVMSRKNIMTEKRYGHELRALAIGNVINGSVSNLICFDRTSSILSGNTTGNTTSAPATYWNSYMFNRVSAKRVGEGKYSIRIPNKWFSGVTNIEDYLQVNLNSKTMGVTPYVSEKSTSAFTVSTFGLKKVIWNMIDQTEGGNIGSYSGVTMGLVDGNFGFMIYNKGDWTTLSMESDLLLTSTEPSLAFSYGQYGSSVSKSLTIGVNNSSASITSAITDTTYLSHFYVSYNSSTKTLTAYPKQANGTDDASSPNVSITIKFTASVGSTTKDMFINVIHYGHHMRVGHPGAEV